MGDAMNNTAQMIPQHDRATTVCQKELARVDDLSLVMRALGHLLRRTVPTIYDLPPDDAALVLELEARGRLKRRTGRR